MADSVYFDGGPLDGTVWQPSRNERVVRIPPETPGDPEITYTDTGRRNDDGDRIYRWGEP